MKVRKNGFFVIQSFMVEDLGLRGNELLVYAIIYGFSQAENQYFTGSLNYLMAWTGGTDKKTVMRALNSLIEKKLLEKNEVIENNIKYCRYKAIKIWEKEQTSMKKNNENIKLTIKENFKMNVEDTSNFSGGEIPLGGGKISIGGGEIPPEVVEKRDWGSGEIPPNNIDNNIDNNIFNNINKSINEAEASTAETEGKLFLLEEDKTKKQEETEKEKLNKPLSNKVLAYINSLNISKKYRDKLIEFYNYRRKIGRRIKTERAITFILNQDFVNEEHAILCIDYAIDNEYQGVKADYVNYYKNKNSSKLKTEKNYYEEDKHFRRMIL